MEDNQELYTVPAPNHTRNIVIGVALLALLSSAAFVGAWLWQSGRAPGEPALFGLMLPGAGGAEMTMSAHTIEIKPAPELPARPPDAIGSLASRTDNQLILNASSNGVMVFSGTMSGSSSAGAVTSGEAIPAEANASGGTVEVVVTRETVIYRDAMGPMMDMSGADSVVQQVVAPGTLDEIGTNTFVTVWGEQRGDRLIAAVILYMR